MLYKNFHFLAYLISSILFIFFILFKKPISLEFDLLSMYDVALVVSFNLTQGKLLFIFTVFLIFSSVYHFSLPYMSSESNVKRFLLVLLSFAISMIFLICSGNLFTTLLGWDGLGVTSMLLIMYYCSTSSLKASMYTFLMNRMGDCFFLLVIFMLCCKYPSFNSILQNSLEQGSTKMVMLFMIFLAITKSAQIPFSSWLTKAMEAPTPVSSLVHSSTLVTAGVYVLYIYQDIWMSETCLILLMVLSISTLLVSSIAGMVETDLKKIVAYSTLSQLGFIFFLFSIKTFEAGFFYLIMHAFFKALMFMSSGYIIHNSSGWQDIRKMTLNQVCSPTVVKIFFVSSMSLCGMPFLAGFYSKDLVLDILLSSNYPSVLMFLMMLSFTFTVMYVLRICWYLSCGILSVSPMSDQDSSMIKSTLILFMCSCLMGSMILWLFLPNFPPLDSPKLGLSIYLITMGLIFWKSPNYNAPFFLKTMFFLYVIHSLVATFFMKISSTLLWYFDLLGLTGNFLKNFPNAKSFDKFDYWLKNYNWSIGDLLMISFLLIVLFKMIF